MVVWQERHHGMLDHLMYQTLGEQEPSPQVPSGEGIHRELLDAYLKHALPELGNKNYSSSGTNSN